MFITLNQSPVKVRLEKVVLANHLLRTCGVETSGEAVVWISWMDDVEYPEICLWTSSWGSGILSAYGMQSNPSSQQTHVQQITWVKWWKKRQLWSQTAQDSGDSIITLVVWQHCPGHPAKSVFTDSPQLLEILGSSLSIRAEAALPGKLQPVTKHG